MKYEVVVSANAVRIPLARHRVAEIARAVLRAERAGPTRLSITFLSNAAIAGMNARHLGHRGATDVISFALEGHGGPGIGDIYISPDLARSNAAEHGTTAREETARLVVHGVLHVLGYDHPNGAERLRSRMWRRQERLVASLARLHSPTRHRRSSRAAA